MKKWIDISLVVEMSTFHEITEHMTYDQFMKRLIKATELELEKIEMETENASTNIATFSEDEAI